MNRPLFAIIVGFALFSGPSIRAQEQSKVTRAEDVIYGRKFGMALTLDVFEPEKKNGAAIFYVVSGGYFSDHRGINPGQFEPLLVRGYTVFAVVHGSQPRFLFPRSKTTFIAPSVLCGTTPAGGASVQTNSAFAAAVREGNSRS